MPDIDLKKALDSLMNTAEQVEKQEEDPPAELRFVFTERDNPKYPHAFILGEKERLITELFVAADITNRIELLSDQLLKDSIQFNTKPEFSVLLRAVRMLMATHINRLINEFGIEVISREEFEKVKESAFEHAKKHIVY